jgi:diaminopimelate epimerase
MGAPIFSPELIPFNAQDLQSTQQHAATLWPLLIGDASVELCVVSMGNPHAVQIVPDVETADVALAGPLIENHVRFPKRVNAGFMQIVDRHHIRLRVYERGAGETLSCGTGACAAAVSGIQRGVLDSPVKVTTHGGILSIAWAGDQQSVFMTGPAMNVFEGSIEI